MTNEPRKLSVEETSAMAHAYLAQSRDELFLPDEFDTAENRSAVYQSIQREQQEHMTRARVIWRMVHKGAELPQCH